MMKQRHIRMEMGQVFELTNTAEFDDYMKLLAIKRNRIGNTDYRSSALALPD